MLIVKLQAEENGARENQLIQPDLPALPEGWAAVPPELTQQALELLPWLSIEVQDGLVTGIADNAHARKLAQERAAAAEESAENADAPGDA